jgi:hypothetical protein
MADAEDEFRVRIGRIGDRRGRKAVGYLKRVRKIANKPVRGNRGGLLISPARVSAAAMRKERCQQAAVPQDSAGSLSRRGSSASRRGIQARSGRI